MDTLMCEPRDLHYKSHFQLQPIRIAEIEVAKIEGSNVIGVNVSFQQCGRN